MKKEYTNSEKLNKLNQLKTEGVILNIDKEILPDQTTLEVSTEIPESSKIEKDEKQQYEDFKTMYKGVIDMKCTQQYGNNTDTKVWEDVAKDLYLKSKMYLPVGDEYKPKQELQDKEIKKESKYLKESLDLSKFGKIKGEQETIPYSVDEEGEEGWVHEGYWYTITYNGKGICTCYWSLQDGSFTRFSRFYLDALKDDIPDNYIDKIENELDYTFDGAYIPNFDKLVNIINNVVSKYLTESLKLNEDNEDDKYIYIHTGLNDSKSGEILDSVIGQLSDGIWENSKGMDKYWTNLDIVKEGPEFVIKANIGDYSSGFYQKTDTQVANYVANKIKQIVEKCIESGSCTEETDTGYKKRGTWDRNCLAKVPYLGYNKDITVKDAYKVYDQLLGRQQKIENKQINEINNDNIEVGDEFINQFGAKITIVKIDEDGEVYFKISNVKNGHEDRKIYTATTMSSVLKDNGYHKVTESQESDELDKYDTVQKIKDRLREINKQLAYIRRRDAVSLAIGSEQEQYELYSERGKLNAKLKKLKDIKTESVETYQPGDEVDILDYYGKWLNSSDKINYVIERPATKEEIEGLWDLDTPCYIVKTIGMTDDVKYLNGTSKVPVTKLRHHKTDTSVTESSDNYQVRKYPNEEEFKGTWGLYDLKQNKFIQKGSKYVMQAALKDMDNKQLNETNKNVYKDLDNIAHQLFDFDDYYIELVQQYDNKNDFMDENIDFIKDIKDEYNLTYDEAYKVLEKIYNLSIQNKSNINESYYVKLFNEDNTDVDTIDTETEDEAVQVARNKMKEGFRTVVYNNFNNEAIYDFSPFKESLNLDYKIKKTESKITDYISPDQLDKAIKNNKILNIANSYKVLDDMLIEITTNTGKSYYKIFKNNSYFEAYLIDKNGKKLGDSFKLIKITKKEESKIDNIIANKGILAEIKKFDDKTIRDSFLNMCELQQIPEKNQIQVLQECRRLTGKEPLTESDDNEYQYMLLDRLRTDCEYFLGNGNRNEKNLWAGSVDAQIKEMKKIWNNLKEKPEWLTMEDINNYEKLMKDKKEIRKSKNLVKKYNKELDTNLDEAKENDLSKHLYQDEADRRIYRRLEFLDVYLEGFEKALKDNDIDNITLRKSQIRGNIEYLIPALNIKGGVDGLIKYLTETDFDFENRFKETANLLKNFKTESVKPIKEDSKLDFINTFIEKDIKNMDKLNTLAEVEDYLYEVTSSMNSEEAYEYLNALIKKVRSHKIFNTIAKFINNNFPNNE